MCWMTAITLFTLAALPNDFCNVSEFLEGELQIEDFFVPVRFTQSGEKLVVQMPPSSEPLVIEFDKWEA